MKTLTVTFFIDENNRFAAAYFKIDNQEHITADARKRQPKTIKYIINWLARKLLTL